MENIPIKITYANTTNQSNCFYQADYLFLVYAVYSVYSILSD